MRRVPRVVLALLACPALLLARQANPPAYRSQVDLVEVPVVVSDPQGRFVSDLTAADFELSERGIPQAITVFDRVSIPIWLGADPSAPAPVPEDVVSNERVADGRIFVLVLDALHVSPQNVLAVRAHARRFVEEHMGPSDLAAVLSPGAVEAASQDFTSDKARLAAAAGRFTGGMLRSATLELEEERRAAVATGVLLHGGKDPSDDERAYRAQSLSAVLEALAGHLARVDRRRKALLLFSEGVDYNVADLMGGVQEHASSVMHAMNRAVGALMQANVSLYAIDPRRLAAPDTSGDWLPAHEAPNAPRADGTRPRMDFSEPSLEGEFAASIASLRNLAESTGGFAAVTGNDPGETFDRIVRESSNYYVIGYVPARRGKPGDFVPIGVRVRRPGLRVVARAGYLVPAASKEPARLSPPPAEPALTPPLAGRRTVRAEIPAIEADAPATPRGVPDELARLLSSPLPMAGLPLRAQAAAFKEAGGKPVVQLVTEVRGSAIRFVEGGGRFEARLELASFTVDSRGRGANGRSTTLDMRLTRAEFDRARTTGIRWLSLLALEPGRYQLRIAAREPAADAKGMVTLDVDVPSFAGDRSLSGVLLTSAAAGLMVTRGQSRIDFPLGTPPTAERVFIAGDRLEAVVEVNAGDLAAAAAAVTCEIERIGGEVVLRPRPQPQEPAGRRPDALGIVLPIETAALPPGRYLLRVQLDGGRGEAGATREVPFELLAGPRG